MRPLLSWIEHLPSKNAGRNLKCFAECVENADAVLLGAERYPVRLTPKRHLREVDFVFEGKMVRGLEQNPATKSRWAEMARSGEKVMQFLKDGRYVANVVDGSVTMYTKRAGS